MTGHQRKPPEGPPGFWRSIAETAAIAGRDLFATRRAVASVLRDVPITGGVTLGVGSGNVVWLDPSQRGRVYERMAALDYARELGPW
jgi:hypothetical protein